MNKCILIGAGEYNNEKITKDKGDLLIACDGGFDYLKKLDLDIDYLIGDFDSIKEIPNNIKIVKFPKQKDETDIFLGLKLGIDKGYKKFYFYGCLGGRIEHSLANIQHIIYLKKRGLEGFLIQNNRVLQVLSNEEIYLSSVSSDKLFSLFSISENTIISIKNAKYELDNYLLTNSFPLGIDNELLDKEVKISVKEGMVLLVRPF